MVDHRVTSMIYEAAVIPEMWPVALAQLGAAVQAFGAALVSVDHNASVRFVSTETYQQTYTRYDALGGFNMHNPRAERAIAGRRFEFVPDTELCTIEELATDQMYELFLRPFGLGWTIGSPVPSPSHDLTYFDLCRLQDDVPFGPSEATLLNQFRPHLARAALLATRLELTRARATADILEKLGLAGAVLASDGTVLAANLLLDELSPRITTSAFDKLHVAHRPAASSLNLVLGAGHTAELPMSIPIPADGESPALVLHVLPVERAAHDIFAKAGFIVFVTPVTRPDIPTADLISGLFDLSPAEAGVARGVAAGHTLQAIADKRDVSLETVRTQLKAVFEKTGTRRQIDLARLLLGGRNG